VGTATNAALQDIRVIHDSFCNNLLRPNVGCVDVCAIGAIAFGMVQLPRLIARLNGTLTIDRQLNAIDVFGQQLIPADVNCVILLTTPGSEGTDTRLLLTTDSEVLRLLETGNDWYDVSDWTIIGESMSRYLGVDFEKRSGEPEDQIQNWQQPPSCLTRYIAIAIAIAIIVLNVIIVFCFIAEFLWGHTHPSDSGGAANL